MEKSTQDGRISDNSFAIVYIHAIVKDNPSLQQEFIKKEQSVSQLCKGSLSFNGKTHEAISET